MGSLMWIHDQRIENILPPAMIRYAHVVVKCLEESPTNLWWKSYYAKGGKQEDLMAHIGESSTFLSKT
jgi:hypothetical protein